MIASKYDDLFRHWPYVPIATLIDLANVSINETHFVFVNNLWTFIIFWRPQLLIYIMTAYTHTYTCILHWIKYSYSLLHFFSLNTWNFSCIIHCFG